MNDPQLVSQVFDGANKVLSTGKAVADAAFTTIDMINNLGNSSQNQQQLYSRRDMGYQMPQQPQPQYHPSAYPWAQQGYAAYGFTQQGYQANSVGYPGISNPNYGVSGYYTPGFFGSSNWSTSSQNNSIGVEWMNHGIWG